MLAKPPKRGDVRVKRAYWAALDEATNHAAAEARLRTITALGARLRRAA